MDLEAEREATEAEVLAAAVVAADAGAQRGYCDVSELRRLIRQARQVHRAILKCLLLID